MRNFFRRLIYDNWLYNLYFFLRQIYTNKAFLNERNIRFSLFHMCLYTILPLKDVSHEILEHPESRRGIISDQTIKKAESIRPIGLNEYLYPEIEEIDLYNVLVKFKANFQFLRGFIKTLIFIIVLYLLYEHTIVIDIAWEHILSLYDIISK